MIELIIGFIITLVSLLIGFSLGKDQDVITYEAKKKIKGIMRKVIPNNDIGPILRPTAQDIYYRDHPKERIEKEVMEKEFEKVL